MAIDKAQQSANDHPQAYPGFIVVKPYEEKPQGAYLIADTNKEQDLSGVVVSVGDDTISLYGTPMTTKVKVGDVIIHKTYYMSPYYLNGKHYRFISFADVAGWIKKA